MCTFDWGWEREDSGSCEADEGVLELHGGLIGSSAVLDNEWV